MAKHISWSDDYWLLLMQLYLKKPGGVKPVFSRAMIDLSLELHIPPRFLHAQMFRLRQLDTPYIEHLWRTYGDNPRKLQREVKLLRQMNGFNTAGGFYEGVHTNESFELDFKPIDTCPDLQPVKLVMILELYFRLTPNTMVKETPEIVELSRLLKITPSRVVEVMQLFQQCDPYLQRNPLGNDPLSRECAEVWTRFVNDNSDRLSALAAQLKEYFVG